MPSASAETERAKTKTAETWTRTAPGRESGTVPDTAVTNARTARTQTGTAKTRTSTLAQGHRQQKDQEGQRRTAVQRSQKQA